MGYILLGIMYICLGIYMVVLMMNVVRKCRKTHSEYYKREIPSKIACLLLLVVDILDIVSLNHRAIHMTIKATSTWFCVILSTYSVRMSDQAYKKH